MRIIPPQKGNRMGLLFWISDECFSEIRLLWCIRDCEMGQCQMANKTSGWSVFDCCYMFVQRGTLRKSRKKVAQSSFFVPIVDISLIRITLRACCASTSVALLLRLFVDTVRRKNNSGTYANLVERYECLCICERQGETFCWIIPGSRRGIIRPKII